MAPPFLSIFLLVVVSKTATSFTFLPCARQAAVLPSRQQTNDLIKLDAIVNMPALSSTMKEGKLVEVRVEYDTTQ